MNMNELNPPQPEFFGYLLRTYRARRRRARGLLNVTALVDLVLLLLLFLVINSAFVLQPGIALDLPAAPFDDGASYSSLVVMIAQEGMVFFNDERTTMDGLAAAFAQAAHDDPGAELVIEADARVQHGALVKIYNMAVAAGIRKVTLATRLPVSGGTAP